MLPVSTPYRCMRNNLHRLQGDAVNVVKPATARILRTTNDTVYLLERPIDNSAKSPCVQRSSVVNLLLVRISEVTGN